MLFDDFLRTDGQLGGHGEPLYSFLNRASGVYWASVRDVLSEWMSHYPAIELVTLESRMRSPGKRSFLGAFWELYLHELFDRLGFSIELHPELSGTNRRPDFRLQKGPETIFVEAVTIYESEADTSEDSRLAPVLDAVNRVPSPNFLVAVDAKEIGRQSLPISNLSSEIASWLAQLDVDSQSSATESADSTFRWEWRGWDLVFTPIPRGPNARGPKDHRTIASYPARGGFVDDHRVIRQRLGEKTRAYGRQFRDPFVIAMLSFRPTTGPEEVLSGLFGPAWEHPNMMLDQRIGRPWSRSASGFWLTNSGAQYQDVSAVLTAFELLPWSVARRQPWLIPNPWACNPLEVELPFNRIDVDVSTGRISTSETGLGADLIFDLPSDWPHGARSN